MELGGESSAVQSELFQFPKGIVGCLGSRDRPNELWILEGAVDQPVAARDRVVDASFEILREPPISESAQQLTGGQGLEFRHLLAESFAPACQLSRLSCK